MASVTCHLNNNNNNEKRRGKTRGECVTYKNCPGATCAVQLSPEDAGVEEVYEVLYVCCAYCGVSLCIVWDDMILC